MPDSLHWSLFGDISKNCYVTKRGPEHFFRKFNGFGISKEVLTSLPSQVDTIVFLYQGVSQEIWYIPRSDVTIVGKTWDDDGDIQYVINRNDMTRLMK